MIFLTCLILHFYLERSFLEILMLELYFTNRFHLLSPFVSSGPYRINSDILVLFSVGFIRKGLRLLCLGLKNLQIEFHCPFF